MTSAELRSIEARQGHDYCDKMMHVIPQADVVDRETFILWHCKGKRVLNLGCASGQLHDRIRKCTATLIGLDKSEPADFICDLDQHDSPIPQCDVELIVAGEILEHLSNPGNALSIIRSYQCQCLITVPNAFSIAGQSWLRRGYEQVNSDHVSWYSYHTLKTLVERYGFTVVEFHWYGGRPLTAEGLIFMVK